VSGIILGAIKTEEWWGGKGGTEGRENSGGKKGSLKNKRGEVDWRGKRKLDIST